MRLDTVIAAEPRSSRGKNEARRLRVTGRVPAVVYGAFKDAHAVSINPKDVLKILRSKTGHNSIFDIDIAGVERTPVIVADEQYDPVKSNLLHIDFRRIDLTRKLRVAVPVHTTGESKGVKQQGGVLDVVTRTIEIECVPDDIPNHFEVDVTELMVGNAVRVSDLPIKEGVRVLTAGEAVVVHVVGIREEAVAVVEPGAAEPAVAVKKGKKEDEAPAADAKGKAAPAAKAPAAKKK